MMSKRQLWNNVKLGSHIKWRTALNTLVTAKVVGFTTPTSMIKIQNDDDGHQSEIWIESVAELEHDGKWQKAQSDD